MMRIALSACGRPYACVSLPHIGIGSATRERACACGRAYACVSLPHIGIGSATRERACAYLFNNIEKLCSQIMGWFRLGFEGQKKGC